MPPVFGYSLTAARVSTHSYRTGRLGLVDGFLASGVLGCKCVRRGKQSPAVVASEWRPARPSTQFIGVYEIVGECGTSKGHVLVTASGELGAHKIMWLHAQTGGALGVLVADGDEPSLPASGPLGCFWSNSVGIEAMGGVEPGAFAECTVDALGAVGMTAWVHVGFA